MTKPTVIVIGAGPAGFTAALELVRDGRYQPIVLEASKEIGGLSRTVVYKGNRIDIGGHRFFSKSDWVMNWWREILPIVGTHQQTEIRYHGKQRKVNADIPLPIDAERVMLIRNRLSRIYFLRKYFDYPIKLNLTTITNLGFVRMMRIGISYLGSMVFPRRPECSLEDFLINRFGKELYKTFFKDYTEKVWGVPCHEISAEWGAQRIKGLSIMAAMAHAIRSLIKKDAQATKTSLIEKFLYPRLGPGQLWETVAERVCMGGGQLHLGLKVTELHTEGQRVKSVVAADREGNRCIFEGAYVISTMPIKDLVAGMRPLAPVEISRTAENLPYRDFITVGLLLKRMLPNKQARAASTKTNMPADNWIYIQERDVRLGRLQIFNNWSPSLVANQETVWVGLEYFCREGDELWNMSDGEMREFAAGELEKIGMIDRGDVLDGTVIRVPKTYPAYFGAYSEFPKLRRWLDSFENLFLIGRNGMHRYNNQDHSMLTAKLAVEAILSGSSDKTAIWSVNIDDEYHEEKSVRPASSS